MSDPPRAAAHAKANAADPERYRSGSRRDGRERPQHDRLEALCQDLSLGVPRDRCRDWVSDCPQAIRSDTPESDDFSRVAEGGPDRHAARTGCLARISRCALGDSGQRRVPAGHRLCRPGRRKVTAKRDRIADSAEVGWHGGARVSLEMMELPGGAETSRKDPGYNENEPTQRNRPVTAQWCLRGPGRLDT